MVQFLSITSSACVLLLSNVLSAATAAAAAAAQGSGIITLPLIPYHEHIKRRRLASVNSHEHDFNGDNSTATTHLRRHRRKLGTRTEHISALYQGYGTHYVDLWVGTPPQRQTLIVDTGSSVTAFPCSKCIDCGQGAHTDFPFSESKSETFRSVPCDKCERGHCAEEGDEVCKIAVHYLEKSGWTATEAIDTVYLGGPHDEFIPDDKIVTDKKSFWDPNHARQLSFEMMFGCQTHLFGRLKTQLADGVLAMDHKDTSFWQQAFNKGIMHNQAFSLCFAKQPQATRGGSEAGAITLGGSDIRLQQTPMVYTHHKRHGEWAVIIRKMYFREGNNGWSVKPLDAEAKMLQIKASEKDMNYGDVLIDSGTTDTYLNKRMAAAFMEAFRAMTGREYSNEPIEMTNNDLDAMPTIILQLAGDSKVHPKLFPNPEDVIGLAVGVDSSNPYDVLVAVPPHHYMEWEPEMHRFIPRIYLNEEKGSILGANIMMGHEVYFDEEKKRIGFAESDCEYGAIVEDITGLAFNVQQSEPQEEELKNEEAQLELEAEEGVEDEDEPDEVIDDYEDGAYDDDDDDIDAAKEEKEHDDENENKEVKIKTKKEYGNVKSTKTDVGREGEERGKATKTLHPAIEACNDWACRGTVVGAILVFTLVGALVGRVCTKQTASQGAYHAPEEMVPSMNDDDDDDDVFDDDDFEKRFSQYRDDPASIEDDDNVYDEELENGDHVSSSNGGSDVVNGKLQPIKIV